MRTSARPSRSKSPAETTAAKPHARAARTSRKFKVAAPGPQLDDWLAAESEIDGEPLLAHQLAHSDT